MKRKYTLLNAEIIDGWCRRGWEWAIPISHEVYEEARRGNFRLLLTPTRPVPREWFGELRGKRVLALASGGGQSRQSAAHKNSSSRKTARKELCRNSLDKVENNADIPQQPADDITDYLSAEGVCVDEIIRASGLTPAEVSLKLLELEMQGRIERQIGNKVALIKR